MPSVQVVAAIILQNDKVLIAQRPKDKHKGGYWEFPGGKIEPGETAKQALSRELKEELNIEIDNCQAFTEIHFDYSEKSVYLKFFIVSEFIGQPKGLQGQPLRWVGRSELGDYQFPEANLPVVEKLQQFKPPKGD